MPIAQQPTASRVYALSWERRPSYTPVPTPRSQASETPDHRRSTLICPSLAPATERHPPGALAADPRTAIGNARWAAHRDQERSWISRPSAQETRRAAPATIRSLSLVA